MGLRGVSQRAVGVLTAVVLVGAALVGCGGGDEGSTGEGGGADAGGSADAAKPRDVTLRLDWIVWPEHAGYFVAKDKGWYEDEGLNVELREGHGSGESVQLVAAGKDTFGTGNPGALIEAAAKGAPVTMVADPFQNSGYSAAYLPSSGIKEPKDLVGKTFAGVAGSPGFTLFPAFLESQGIDPDSVKKVTVQAGSEMTGLTSGRFDAVEWNSFAAPLSKAAGADEAEVFAYGDYGIINLGWGIFVHNDTLKDDPDMVKSFVTASLKGWEYALENPDEAAKIMIATAEKSTIDEPTMAAMIRNLKDLTHTDATEGQPLGCMAVEDWEETMAFEKDFQKVTNPPAIDEVMTNSLIDGCEG
jgi:NitT/TauT family transport system substrate-binding protein